MELAELQKNWDAFGRTDPTWQDEQAAALRYIEQHPGDAYFPWNPLEHLAAEGRLYHFEYGVFDRDLAGYPLTADHFRRHIPEDPRLICYPPRTTVGDQVTLRYLGEFRERIKVDELPKWDCYRRPEPSPIPEDSPAEPEQPARGE